MILSRLVGLLHDAWARSQGIIQVLEKSIGKLIEELTGQDAGDRVAKAVILKTSEILQHHLKKLGRDIWVAKEELIKLRSDTSNDTVLRAIGRVSEQVLEFEPGNTIHDGAYQTVYFRMAEVDREGNILRVCGIWENSAFDTCEIVVIPLPKPVPLENGKIPAGEVGAILHKMLFGGNRDED